MPAGGTEPLEPRMLLAGNTFEAHVNFQPASAPAHPGYLVDAGLVYGSRGVVDGTAYEYGWNARQESSTKDRNSPASPDQRYDTLTQMNKTSVWSIAVPSGTYLVHAVAGDPTATSATYKLDVENVPVVNGTATAASRWVEGTAVVTVTDGRLTLTNGAGASGNKICFIDIKPYNAPPGVALTSPADGAMYAATATIPLRAAAADSDGAVINVEFFAGATKVGEDTNGADGWGVDWSAGAVGVYSLTARATDDGGAVTISAPVSVRVNTPPAVRVSSPAPGAVLNPGAPTTLAAEASDPDGVVSAVNFFANGQPVGTATPGAGGFTLSWTPAAAGPVEITAQATDDVGSTTTASPVAVRVNSPPTATVTLPATGTDFVAPAEVRMEAAASDADGAVTAVTFFVDGAPVGTDADGSDGWAYTWRGEQAGSHSLTAAATDNDGAAGAPSAAVGIRVASTSASFDVAAFGAVGDGVADDQAAIQRAINAAPAGAAVHFGAGKTYRLTRSVVVEKSLTLEANGATLLLDTSAHPQNVHLKIHSRLGADLAGWQEPVAAGQDVLNVAVPPDLLRPGDLIYVELGQDPYDAFEEHFGSVCTVLENTGSAIRIDRAVPYAINQGTRPHRIAKVESFANNVAVRNLRIDHTAAALPDTNVDVFAARNVEIANLTGRFTNAVVAVASQDVHAHDVSGTLVHLVPSGGRVLTTYQGDRVRLTNASVVQDVVTPAVFVESWARDTVIDHLTVDWRAAGAPNAGVFHLTGGSQGTRIENVVVDNARAGSVILVTEGGTTSDYRFGTATVTGEAKAIPVDRIGTLVWKGVTYGSAREATATFELTSNMADVTTLLVRGMIRRVLATVSRAGVTGSFILNNNRAGYEFSGRLVPGKMVDLGRHWAGTDYPLNDPAFPDKFLHLYTGANVPTGATLTLTVEYFPTA